MKISASQRPVVSLNELLKKVDLTKILDPWRSCNITVTVNISSHLTLATLARLLSISFAIDCTPFKMVEILPFIMGKERPVPLERWTGSSYHKWNTFWIIGTINAFKCNIRPFYVVYTGWGGKSIFMFVNTNEGKPCANLRVWEQSMNMTSWYQYLAFAWYHRSIVVTLQY